LPPNVVVESAMALRRSCARTITLGGPPGLLSRRFILV
jgi:hypothetical protein